MQLISLYWIKQIKEPIILLFFLIFLVVCAGKTLDKALENAWQGLIFHIEGMQAAGEVISKPSTLENIMQQKTHKKAMPAAVKIIMPTGHMKRVNISMDVGLLNEIGMAAKLAGRNRSEFLADAARYMLT